MTAFLLYLAGFLVSWYLWARVLYTSLVAPYTTDTEAAVLSVALAFMLSTVWFIFLPVLLLFFLVRFVGETYGASIPDMANKFLLDKRRR